MKTRTIENVKEEIAEVKSEMDSFEIDNDKQEESYCDMLDELSTVKIGSLEYSASRVLREVDPVAYRCGLNDYVDGLEVTEDEDYQALEERLEELETELEELEDEDE